MNGTTSKPDCNNNDKNNSTTSLSNQPTTASTNDNSSTNLNNNSPSTSTPSPTSSSNDEPQSNSTPSSTSPGSITGNSATTQKGNKLISTLSTTTTKPTTPKATTPKATTLKATTNTPIRSTTNSIKPSSTTAKPTSPTSPTAATSKPPSSTTKKPSSSKIVFKPLVMQNPHNAKNSTNKIDEKEALKRFIEELRKQKPLSKEKEVELTAMFKEVVEKKNKNKELSESSPQIENQSLLPKMNRVNEAKPEATHLKLNRIENELNIENLEKALNYYTNLADNHNSTVYN